MYSPAVWLSPLINNGVCLCEYSWNFNTFKRKRKSLFFDSIPLRSIQFIWRNELGFCRFCLATARRPMNSSLVLCTHFSLWNAFHQKKTERNYIINQFFVHFIARDYFGDHFIFFLFSLWNFAPDLFWSHKRFLSFTNIINARRVLILTSSFHY